MNEAIKKINTVLKEFNNTFDISTEPISEDAVSGFRITNLKNEGSEFINELFNIFSQVINSINPEYELVYDKQYGLIIARKIVQVQYIIEDIDGINNIATEQSSNNVVDNEVNDNSIVSEEVSSNDIESSASLEKSDNILQENKLNKNNIPDKSNDDTIDIMEEMDFEEEPEEPEELEKELPKSEESIKPIEKLEDQNENLEKENK